MIELTNRNIDNWGNVIFKSDSLLDFLMSGNHLTPDIKVIIDDKIAQFNKMCRTFDHSELELKSYTEPTISVEESDNERQNTWFISDEYKNLNIEEFLYNKCKTEEEVLRVQEELLLYKSHNFLPVLNLLVYIIDSFKKNNIIWGVGRGSSVSSFILYLIGVHKVNSIKYDLDIHEFLK